MSEVIRAAGGVLWRRGPTAREVAVIHRPRYDDWSLPKGKLETDEPHLLAALREIAEETGHVGRAGTSLGGTAYDVHVDGQLVPKKIRWWSVEATGGAFSPNREVDELRWLAPADALSLLGTSEPLSRWLHLPADAAVVLLVRHASAGDPDTWRGADRLRPLDARGLGQAEALARLLAAFEPVRILSAPALRCQDTVAPLAAHLAMVVEVDPLLGEEGAPGRPEEHVARLAAPGAAVVVCSQGGVIPRVVEALAPGRSSVRARKGSVWTLTFAGGQLLTADDTLWE